MEAIETVWWVFLAAFWLYVGVFVGGVAAGYAIAKLR